MTDQQTDTPTRTIEAEQGWRDRRPDRLLALAERFEAPFQVHDAEGHAIPDDRVPRYALLEDRMIDAETPDDRFLSLHDGPDAALEYARVELVGPWRARALFDLDDEGDLTGRRVTLTVAATLEAPTVIAP